MGRTDKLKGGGLRSNHGFDQKTNMKEAITKNDKLNVEWIGMQILLKSREITKWLMPFLCDTKATCTYHSLIKLWRLSL